jgi:hypothetical protein
LSSLVECAKASKVLLNPSYPLEVFNATSVARFTCGNFQRSLYLLAAIDFIGAYANPPPIIAPGFKYSPTYSGIPVTVFKSLAQLPL